MQSAPADEYSGTESDGFGSESDAGSESGEASGERQGTVNSADEQPASEDFEAHPEENGEIPRDSLL